MRIITFSIFRHFKSKPMIYYIPKRLYSDVKVKLADTKTTVVTSDPNFIDVSPLWPTEESDMRKKAVSTMRIFPNFVTEEEEAALLAEVEPQLKKLRYEYDHWDNAIEGYRETDRESWNDKNRAVLHRIHETAFTPGSKLLPRPHILDLAVAGYIKPHIDAVRPVGVYRLVVMLKFCGDTIAGLCLLSSAVMRLVHETRPELRLDALLERRCLYVMSGCARYEFTHAVLGGDDSVWRGKKLQRKRRVAIICREQPKRKDD